MTPTDTRMMVDALMALVNRYAEACDDLGTDLFAQDATKHAALRAAAAGIYAQIRAGIEQYGLEIRAAVTGPMDSHGRYWVENRGKIIDALSEAGIRLMSDEDRFWVRSDMAPSRHSLTTGPAQAIQDVVDERRRQIEIEGWTPEHDDEYSSEELAFAAACYATAEEHDAPPAVWPWVNSWWKPKDRRRNMVRAAALLLAGIERLDRAAPK